MLTECWRVYAVVLSYSNEHLFSIAAVTAAERAASKKTNNNKQLNINKAERHVNDWTT